MGADTGISAPWTTSSDMAVSLTAQRPLDFGHDAQEIRKRTSFRVSDGSGDLGLMM
jgi:hypothetical protein